MKEELTQGLFWLWREHRGASLGLLLGLALGTSVLIFGFWQTLFVTICCLLGLWLGHELDSKADILDDLGQLRDGLARLLPGRFHRPRKSRKYDYFDGPDSYEHFE